MIRAGGWVQFKFIRACGSRCTHLVHLHQSWENLRRNPAVKRQIIFSYFQSRLKGQNEAAQDAFTPNLFGAVQTNSGGLYDNRCVSAYYERNSSTFLKILSFAFLQRVRGVD